MKEITSNKFIDGLVSVIVPVYNAKKDLSRCLGSIINQTYKKLEIILINDGSNDKSGEICDESALTDDRIKVISQKNRGPAAARNTGVRQATGDFVFFIDADDFIEKNAIEILIAKYNLTQPDLVMANFSKLENNGEIIKQDACFRPDDKPFKGEIKYLSKADITDYVRHFLKQPTNHLVSYCWARLYKLSIIKKNNILANEDIRLFEDFVFNLDYLKYTNEIVFVNESLYTYTMHNDHISASMVIVNSDSLLPAMEVFKTKASEFLRLPNANKEIGQALIHYVIIFLVRSCRQINRQNRKIIYSEINKIVNASIVKDSLQYYSPARGNSRILPWLMKFKLVGLIMFICQYRAYKRYGKLVNV